ncbi:hypothetical protein JNB71_15560 [Rhizobium herbae]|uniref:Uncharacterized protein n=1 Tax=Rhizobium herbae TaxID=508661 RepID=A0ABS7HBT3_9HYPH|nr:hypothetical protein [Rhizobium herbae]MBW9064732.1 hypothetical protein [Rhizobium herbae]
MTTHQTTIPFSELKVSAEAQIEEFHAIARLVVFARESAVLLEAEQTVYCLDLALEQIAKELRHRADVSHEIASYFKEGIKRQ